MHAKYRVSVFYGSKFIAKVKVDNRQTNRTKQYAPDHLIRGHKNSKLDSNPVPSAYEAIALNIALLDLISIEH